jgi:hypothetical protein
MLVKSLLICSALVLSACSAADYSGASLPKNLTRSNVSCGGASVPGFTLSRATVERFISQRAADACGDAEQVALYTVVPASVDVFRLDEVLAYLETIGEDNVEPVFRPGGQRCRAVARDPDGGAGSCFEDDGLAGSTGARAVSGSPRGDNW